jgi:pyruvate,water dikinase
MERGGLLSHGAVVAREYGLPAVAGIPGVTQLLHNGEEIEVDGTAGAVKIVGVNR